MVFLYSPPPARPSLSPAAAVVGVVMTAVWALAAVLWVGMLGGGAVARRP